MLFRERDDGVGPESSGVAGKGRAFRHKDAVGQHGRLAGNLRSGVCANYGHDLVAERPGCGGELRCAAM